MGRMSVTAALAAALAGCAPTARSVLAPRPVRAAPGVTVADAAPSLPADPVSTARRYPRAPDGGVVWSRLPAPHRTVGEPMPEVRTIDDARALVGIRDRRAPLTVALAWSTQLTGRPTPAVSSEAALIAWAQRAAAWRAVPAIAAGDLIVFDRAVGGARASLIAVALARDPRGVVEVLYLGGGVVRRGFFDVTRPHTVRDRGRHVVNSALRHNRDQPPRGTHFLAGELFAGVISTAAPR